MFDEFPYPVLVTAARSTPRPRNDRGLVGGQDSWYVAGSLVTTGHDGSRVAVPTTTVASWSSEYRIVGRSPARVMMSEAVVA